MVNVIKLSNILGVTYWLCDFVAGKNPAHAGPRHQNTKISPRLKNQNTLT
jgi:hypothetical protein